MQFSIIGDDSDLVKNLRYGYDTSSERPMGREAMAELVNFSPSTHRYGNLGIARSYVYTYKKKIETPHAL